MPGKSWKDRVKEMLETIETAKLAKNGKAQADVAGQMQRWAQGLDKNFAETISKGLSLKDADDKPEKKGQRDLLRAAKFVMLYEGFLKTGLVDTDFKKLDSLPQDNLANTLDDAIGAAHAAMEKALPPALDTAFNKLITNPAKFLAKHRVQVNGIAAPSAGKKNTYRFYYDIQKDMYGFDASDQVTPMAFTPKEAWLIPVTNFSTIKNSYGAIVPAVVKDVSLALTTQFSGCTYCFQVSKDRKKLRAAHIDPEKGKGETGETLSAKLRQGGAFSEGNDGKFYACGRVANPNSDFGYGAGYTVIIAIKGGGGWEIYAQTINGKVLTVKQIFDPSTPDP